MSDDLYCEALAGSSRPGPKCGRELREKIFLVTAGIVFIIDDSRATENVRM